ncbi:MAG: glycosyltransferase [Pseudomonadota bacterium]
MQQDVGDALESHDRKYDRVLAVIQRPEISVVSFDIFDTLIARNVWDPKDIFLLMSLRSDVRRIIGGEPFDVARVLAEKAVRADLTDVQRDPTLAEIYVRLMMASNLSEDAAQELKRIEIQYEYSAVIPREPIRRLWRYVKAIKKNVILCSDMYLPRPVLENMLTSCGYDASDRIFLSCELGATKKHGTIFPIVQDELRCTSREILHLGDNKHSDIKMAERAGWNALHIPTLGERALKGNKSAISGLVPDYRRGADVSSLANRSSLKLTSERLLAKTLSEVSPGGEMSGSDFGYAAVGPFLLSLLLWIRRVAQQKGLEHVLFLARDGHLPLKAMERLNESLGSVFTSDYLPISRRVVFPWLLSRPGGFDSIANIGFRPGLSVGNYLTERFGEAGLQVFRESKGDDADRLMQYLLYDWHEDTISTLRANLDRLQSLSAPAVARTSNFYASRVPEGRKTALFDVGRKGTFQRILENILGRQVHGFYVVNSPDIYKNSPGRNFDSFLGTIDPYARRKNPDTMIYEAILSEQAGGFFGIDEGGEPLRGAIQLSEEESELFTAVQSGAMRYIEDAIKNFGSQVHLLEQEPFHASYAMENWQRNEGAAKLFRRLKHEDSISDQKPRSLADLLSPSSRSRETDHRLFFPPRREEANYELSSRNDSDPNRSHRRVVIYCPAMTSVRGGAERVTAMIANYLSKSGDEVLVLCSTPSQGGRKAVYPMDASVLVREVNARSCADISSVVEAFSPDVGAILASGPVVARIGDAFLENGVPYLVSERADPEHSYSVYWRGYEKSDYVASHASADLIAIQFSSFANIFPDSVKSGVVTLPNPVTLPDQSGSVDFQDRELTIICPARIWFEQKRQDVLLEAFGRVAEKHNGWKLKFFGHPYGDDANRLRERASEIGLGNRVSVHSASTEIEQEMDRARLFVLPSAFEGFPNSLAEALASGLPAIGFSTCSGVNQLIRNDVNGRLVDDGHLDAKSDVDNNERIALLARELDDVMSDQAVLKRYSDQAASSVSDYAADRVLELWNDAFERLRTSETTESDIEKRRQVLRDVIAHGDMSGPDGKKEDLDRFERECTRMIRDLLLENSSIDMSRRLRIQVQQARGGSARLKSALKSALIGIDPKNLMVPSDFDETAYRRNNPDVAQAIREGNLASGYIHYLLYGFSEGRVRPSVTR